MLRRIPRAGRPGRRPRHDDHAGPASEQAGTTEQAGPTADPYGAALALLARRDLSKAQVRVRLVARGVPPALADEAVARLATTGALDDRRTAAAYARTAVTVKGRGRLRVLRELAAMGIDDAVARGAVEEALAGGGASRALEHAVRRVVKGPLTDARAYRRASAALLRLGFAAGEVRAALQRHAGDSGDAVADEPFTDE